MQYLKGLLFILIAIEIILTGFITYTEFSANDLCLTGQSCAIVKNSQYSEIFGLRLSYFGLASFIILLGVYSLTYKKKIPSAYFIKLSWIGAFFAIYFLMIQIFVIKAICSNCLMVDSLAIIIAIIAKIDHTKSKQKSK